MKEVRYIGPYKDGVILFIGDDERAVKFGEKVEVADELAASLVEQEENWEIVPAKKGDKGEEGGK